MRKLFVLGMAIAMLTSCQKEDNPVDEQTSYFPLDIGNYWIYQHYDIDSSGNETLTSITDSTIITGDTIINSNTYYILEGTNYPFNSGDWGIIDVLRDSSGYLVNASGYILFSSDNFIDTLYNNTFYPHGDSTLDPIYSYIIKMEKLQGIVSLPAGTFTDVINYKGTVTTTQTYPGIDNPRYINKYYAKEVGKVLDTYFFMASSKISEKRLIKYYINNK